MDCFCGRILGGKDRFIGIAISARAFGRSSSDATQSLTFRQRYLLLRDKTRQLPPMLRIPVTASGAGRGGQHEKSRFPNPLAMATVLNALSSEEYFSGPLSDKPNRLRSEFLDLRHEAFDIEVMGREDGVSP